MRGLLIALFGPRPKLAAIGLVARWLFWFAIGHLIPIVAGVLVARSAGPREGLYATAGVEALLFGVGFVFRPVRTWGQAYRFLRKWPAVYGTIAHRPTVVDVEAPTLNKARSRAVGMRPLLAAPWLIPVPRIRGGVVTWRCFPPPGKTFADMALNADSIAAANRTVNQVMVDYRKTTSSTGRLVVIFGDPLTETIKPDWARQPTTGIPTTRPTGLGPVDLGDAT